MHDKKQEGYLSIHSQKGHGITCIQTIESIPDNRRVEFATVVKRSGYKTVNLADMAIIRLIFKELA